MKGIHSWISMLALCASLTVPAMAEDAPLFDVPRLHSIRIDGDPADWGDDGFLVGAVASIEGTMPPAADLDTR